MSNPNPKANGLFAELTARMADVNLGDLDEPIDEVRDDEEVVGVLTDELRRLYTLRSQEIDALAKLKASRLRRQADLMEQSLDREQDAKLRELSEQLKVRASTHDLIEHLFVAALNLEFPATADKVLVIREGWRVVILEDPHSCGISAALLAAMLGG